MSKQRLRLTVAYDGRPFKGWQSQTGANTVQDLVQAALDALCEGSNLQGAGRTDAGVHALAQSAHADVPSDRFTLRQWRDALNAHLPSEIRITACRWAPPDFHARFKATGKRYLYRIWNGPVLPPLEVGRAWHVWQKLDLARLKQGAAILKGRHDFFAFSANRGTPPKATIRTLRRLSIHGKPGGLLELRFEAEGFLYKMARLLTGSLVRVGQGKAEVAWLQELLCARKEKSSFAAPAHGLYLERVIY